MMFLSGGGATARPRGGAGRVMLWHAWIKAISLAMAAVYGPFLAMAVVMQSFVACPHCRAAAWQLLPVAGGFVPGMMLFRQPVDSVGPYAFGVALSALVAIGLTALLRRGGVAPLVVLVAIAGLSSLAAMLLYGAIRS
jgi:hypothetical protein